MAIPTYIVEGSTLINRIHELKQWVYDGSIQIHVPLCALDQVEAAYKVSLIPKEVPKEVVAKKTSGRAARKEQPLFDINPRTAQEYLSRAQSEKGEEGVKIQLVEEQFTQWKEEEKEAAKPETPPSAPTSFAEALLRKLNIKDETGSSGSKGPSKPRLVARANEPKSPWKYQKIPMVSSKGLSATLKPLFSCILWCLYEFENNPLMPETFVLLLDDPEARALAESLNIPVKSYAAARLSIMELRTKHDNRLQSGQMELDFPAVANRTALRDEHPIADGNDMSTNGIEQFDAKSDLGVDHDNEQTDDIMQADLSTSILAESPLGSEAIEPEKISQEAVQAPIGQPTSNGSQETKQDDYVKESDIEQMILSMNGKRTSTISPEPSAAEVVGMCNGSHVDTPVLNSATISKEQAKESSESEVDSDEEVIVFNPRARRASGLPKKSTDAVRSRPATANGLNPPKLADLPEKPTEVIQSKPITANGHPPQPNATLKLRPPIESTLKPQSPVFTPGQIYIPSQAQVLEPKVSAKGSETAESNQSQETTIEVAHKDVAQDIRARPTPTPPPRHPRAALQQKHPSQEQLHFQRQSERIIQRQRELIQRQTKTTEKAPQAPQTPQPPRQIQMEPTNNPTVIDPNDFDRSYVVQPLANTSDASSNKRRSGGHRRRSPKNGSKDHTKELSKDTPKSSPKREVKRQDVDVDFVLKSGAPRGSTRGRGKLWIP